MSKDLNPLKFYLMGGTGNILFQGYIISACRNYIENEGENRAILINDVLTKSNAITRALNWSVHDQLGVQTIRKMFDSDSWFTERICQSTYHLLLLHLSKLIGTILGRNIEIFGHLYCQFPIKERAITRARHIAGYFQERNWRNNGKKFDAYCDAIRDHLPIKASKIDDHKIVIHFRSGDRRANREFVIARNEFLNDVINYELVAKDGITVVTDDVEDAQRFFSTLHGVAIVRGSLIDDFLLMRCANVLVLGNSTLAWWAAKLGNHTAVYVQRDIVIKMGQP